MEKPCYKKTTAGFTLIEVLIALVISTLVIGAFFMTYLSQQKGYARNRRVAEIQQNIRASGYILLREIRRAGFDPSESLNTGITSISNNSAITFTADDGNGGVDTITFAIDNANNTLDRTINASGAQTLANNIEALGFAYAFDNDGDGALDTYNAGGNQRIIWAVDSDGDDLLDTNLDATTDGVIDENDGPGPGGNGAIAGTPLSSNVPMQDIRAVRVWILGRSARGIDNHLNTLTYTVGDRVITPSTDGNANNDDRIMRLSDITVKCKNMGL